MSLKMSEEEYVENVEENNGYCTNCEEITKWGDTEPDAENYKCPECDECCVMGMETAMMEELIEIE